MSIFKSILKGCCVAVMLGSAAGAMASSVSHHRHVFGLSGSYCDDAGSAVCVAFVGDASLTIPVSEVDNEAIVIDGQNQQESDGGLIGGGNGFVYDLDLGLIKSYKVTNFHAYISSIQGKPVNHLCDINLAAQDLHTPKQIVMTLHVDSAGNYTCLRS